MAFLVLEYWNGILMKNMVVSKGYGSHVEQVAGG